MKITELKSNPKNPRIIKDDKFKKLVKSIKDFPEMMEKRPMVCVTDSDGKLYPLGGNMRLKALQELKYKEIPDNWIMLADEWSEEKRKEFIIKDNVGFGEWDWEQLNSDWDVDKLEEWGLDVPDNDLKNDIKPEIDLATELKTKLNYVVLIFENETDWRNALTVFDLNTEKTIRKNGKEWARGIGRVIDGSTAINKLLNV